MFKSITISNGRIYRPAGKRMPKAGEHYINSAGGVSRAEKTNATYASTILRPVSGEERYAAFQMICDAVASLKEG